MERDGETNLLNFELRQFDPRLGRWYNPDPMGQHHSPYLAMGNNPVSSIDPNGGSDWALWGSLDGSGNNDGANAGQSAKDNANYVLGMIEQAKINNWQGMTPEERNSVAGFNGRTYESQFANQIMDNVDAFGSYTSQGKEYYYSEKRGVYGYWSDDFPRSYNIVRRTADGSGNKAFETGTNYVTVGQWFHRVGLDQFNVGIRQKMQLQNDLMAGLKMVEGLNPFSNLWDATSMLVYGTDKYGNKANTTDFAMATLGSFPGGNLEKGLAKTEMTTVIGRMDDLVKYAENVNIDTWHKSGIFGTRVTWAENKAWLDARILRGDKFAIATDPKSLPSVINGYIPGTPNGYFTARELQYLKSQGINVTFIGN